MLVAHSMLRRSPLAHELFANGPRVCVTRLVHVVHSLVRLDGTGPDLRNIHDTTKTNECSFGNKLDPLGPAYTPTFGGRCGYAHRSCASLRLAGAHHPSRLVIGSLAKSRLIRSLLVATFHFATITFGLTSKMFALVYTRVGLGVLDHPKVDLRYVTLAPSSSFDSSLRSARYAADLTPRCDHHPKDSLVHTESVLSFGLVTLVSLDSVELILRAVPHSLRSLPRRTHHRRWFALTNVRVEMTVSSLIRRLVRFAHSSSHLRCSWSHRFARSGLAKS